MFGRYINHKRMKKIYLVALFMSFAFASISQNDAIDARLNSKFSKKELQELQSKNPSELAFLNFYVANAYQVTPMPSGKGGTHEIKGSVKLTDINTINIYELNLTPLQKDYQYYTIEGTDKLLVIISDEQIRAKYNQLKK